MSSKNPILQTMSNWFRRTFSDPGAVSLFFTIIIGVLFLEFFGNILMPILVGIVIAYLLLVLVKLLKSWKCPHLLAVLIVYCLFVGVIAVLLFILLPLLWKQMSNLVSEIPQAFTRGQLWVGEFISKHPRLFSNIQAHHMIELFRDQTDRFGQVVLRYSLATIPGVIQFVIYFVLVPLLVFFFLKDSEIILNWLSQYMPSNRNLVLKVWSEVNDKIGAYVRGRVLEIIIVGAVSMIVFVLLGLQYAILLGSLVGLSVIVPYIGAIVVTIPVTIAALMQWGLSAQFTYLIIAYGLIILLDGNLLAPLLLSETMNMHPVVIILAVVVFGGIWGFWGVFFAVPLATLVNAILKAWPRAKLKSTRY